jgi:hypothetical protein
MVEKYSHSKGAKIRTIAAILPGGYIFIAPTCLIVGSGTKDE